MGVTVSDHFYGVERSVGKPYLGWAISQTTACRHDPINLGEATSGNLAKFKTMNNELPNGATAFLDEMETQFGIGARNQWTSMTTGEQADMLKHAQWMRANGFLPT